MRREDTRYRSLLKEIEAFTSLYKTETHDWFVEFTNAPSHMTDQAREVIVSGYIVAPSQTVTPKGDPYV
ncbi:hypothetical protein KSC_016330 [Ktedonobacter sp. SOSP1-52]|uniref:hypothetical protein n=1 Tax=Ktedonobacter sp. SOSP1-52 TaxID=2778366 RepID=UPI001915B6E3|nr:hypothetical protein [Ktedonobacter sp. SOSP1-52]GHO62741.1 hypothetical protein KSC_016330 [Ktedonobacter sp. SOSP1-52]